MWLLLIFSLTFAVTQIPSSSDAVTFTRVKKVENYFLIEGTERTFTCVASDVDATYDIVWSVDDVDDQPLTNKTGEILIVNSKQGNDLTSSITVKKPKIFVGDRIFLYCKLEKNGTHEDDKSFDFRYLARKDIPRTSVTSHVINSDYNQNVNLTCTVTGDLGFATFKMTWSKNGNVLKESEQSDYGADSEFVYSVAKANSSTAGSYTCRVFHEYRGYTMENSTEVKLNVYSKLLGDKSRSQYVSIGDQIKLPCDIDGYPLSITWQKDSKPITSDKKYKQLNGGKLLVIDKFQPADEGKYACSSKDKDSYDITQNMDLMLKVLPGLKNGSKPSTDIFVDPNKKRLLQCDIIAQPDVCVSWSAYNPKTKKNVEITKIPEVNPPDRCQKELELKNVSNVPDGLVFSCHYKESGKDKVKQSFVLVKMSAPKLTGEPSKELKSEEGDDVTLTCEIDSNPITIAWFKDDKPINGSGSSKYKISKSDPKKLVIVDVSKSDRGSFYCIGKNELDKDGVKQEIILRVKNPIDWVWPVIGIIIVAIVVALIIGFATFRMRRRKAAQQAKDDLELKEAAGTTAAAGVDDHDGGPDAQLLSS